MKIAFIGLGNMGGGMAANLVKAGHEVAAFDVSEAARARAAEQGCTPFPTIGAALAGAEAVITMLPNGAIVRTVYTDDVLRVVAPGTVLIDSSTIDLDTARSVIQMAAEAGCVMVDAPVSGGVAAAAAGTLTFMVGGTDAGFARAAPVLEPMAKAVIRAGESGAGQIAKMCNNMLLAIHMIGTCEALKLAERAGLDPQTFYEISSRSTGSCWSLDAYTPMPGVGAASPADNGYAGGFASALMLKDLRLAMAGAAGAGANVALGEHATALYEAFVEQGGGAKDFGAIFTTL
ncbi:3-hydroxyisobutyrate dehydrogenase [Novosphingobium sp. 1949]|uniref:3-hydroxyisobutyrate dehydrogenase n=1 Tax=Novosphingobium organovorum TaxID=2930092 RepID=A0ABT0B9Q4_9SPHN|nr:3-hydroxyisobutyrate dehydrogenase [Novosphingobium organovorum]MCJ2181561.1 3-hydroxyisobutyrate dehydrogenase [Novosphingobium organovorum]